MGIPIDITLIFMVLSFFLLVIIILILFFSDEITLNKCVAAMILCILNVIISYSAAYSLFVVSLYGYDYLGELVENNIYEIAPFGMIFVVIAYMCIILTFYAIYLCYSKPWKETLKSYGKRPQWYEV